MQIAIALRVNWPTTQTETPENKTGDADARLGEYGTYINKAKLHQDD